ncbi:MAG: hypothetical protein KDB22_09805 [Planctomycetales bacterium]|nr:hypothetical protein [Planctomycetales bacterium]
MNLNATQTVLLNSSLGLLIWWLLLANTAKSEAPNVQIAPHAVVQLDQAGMVELDHQGRFLTNRGSTSPRSMRRVYDVDQPKITDIGFYHGAVRGGRWFVESPLDAIYVWSLNGKNWPLQLQIPVSRPPQYSDPRIDPSGKYLVCVNKTPGRQAPIHIWELREGLPRERVPTELGAAAQVRLRIGIKYEFTANNGLLVMDSTRFLRWDLNEPDSPPKEFQLGPDAIPSHHWQLGQWTAEPPFRKGVQNLPFMVWETRNGDWYYTDFPANPVSHSKVKLQGRPVAIDGSRAISEQGGQLWFCRLDDSEHNHCVQLGTSEYELPKRLQTLEGWENTILPMAYFIGDSGFVLVRLKSGFVRKVNRSRTYVAATDQNVSTPVTVQELDQQQYDALGSDTFRWGKRGNWLVGRFPDGYRYWDLRESVISGEGRMLEGLQEPSGSSFVLNDRWLILFEMNGDMSCADLHADQPPRATKFFSLGTKDFRFRKDSHVAASGFCVRDQENNTAYVWRAAQFDSAFQRDFTSP